MTDQLREEFEAWAKGASYFGSSLLLRRVISDTRYESMETEWAFRAYCAARASAPAANPECGNTPYDEGPFTLATPDARPADERDKIDAERYRRLRRGQKWSVINGIGEVLRAEQLDAAIDAVRQSPPVAKGDGE